MLTLAIVAASLSLAARTNAADCQTVEASRAHYVRLCLEDITRPDSCGLIHFDAGNLELAAGYWAPIADQIANHQNPQMVAGLGVLYREGIGFLQDWAEAVRLFRLAAEMGGCRGQLELGRMYVQGMGVPEDLVAAHMWFNIAAAHGDLGAAIERGTVAQEMTNDEILRAQRAAREWAGAH